jgi:hypothetical protein
MNLSKLTATTVLALTIALPTGQALSQEKQQTVDRNLNQAEQNLDNTGENLKDAGKSFGNSVENTGEAAGQGIENAGQAVEQKANWGWLGLLGLLGLFGLAGKNRRTEVAHRDLQPLDPSAANRTNTNVL